MFKKITVISVLAFIAFTLLLTGCVVKNDEKEVKVGYFPNLTHAPALIGLNKGWFNEAIGKDAVISTKTFVAGPALMEALIAGEVDIAYVGPVPAINTFIKGVELRIIAGVNNGGAILLARKDAQIKNVSDLAGKRVGVPQFANTQDISLRHLLKEAGLKTVNAGGTVDVIQVAPSDMAILFTNSQIDAAIVPEPWGSQLQQAGAKVVLEWNEIWNKGNYPTTVLVTTQQFMDKNPELIRKWLEVHRKTVDFINRNPEETHKILNTELKKLTGKELSDKTMDSAFARSTVTVDVDEKLIREFGRLSFEAGYLKKEPDLSKLVDKSMWK
ncbi:MAG: aliphatic sulfonate ABC transporter substrate-binding protein [Bacillota bacterium]